MFLVIGTRTEGGRETIMADLIANLFMGDALHVIPFWQLVVVPHGGYWKIDIPLGMVFRLRGRAIVEQSCTVDDGGQKGRAFGHWPRGSGRGALVCDIEGYGLHSGSTLGYASPPNVGRPLFTR